MEKNPISFLQEYMMAHKREIPNYVIVSQSVGTHINSFVMKVECDGHVAEGCGSSKKEAKTKTAINMLKLLKLYPNQITSNPSSPYNNSNSCPRAASSICQNIVLPDSPTSGINYIGKLQELTANKSAMPEYILKNVSGPAHNHLFTYICKLEDRAEEATGKTKKEAKTLAAKKMFEKISAKVQIFIPEKKHQSYLDTVISSMNHLQLYENDKDLMTKSVAKALENYPKVNKSGKKVLTDNRSYGEYHTFLKNSFSNDEIQAAINHLQETIKLYENSCKGNEQLENPKNILHIALKILNINMCEVRYRRLETSSVYGLKLLTNPTISEIGFGIDKIAAENMAVYQIAKTLTLMLLE